MFDMLITKSQNIEMLKRIVCRILLLLWDRKNILAAEKSVILE